MEHQTLINSERKLCSTKSSFILILIVFTISVHSQALFVNGSYTQNFGTTPIAAWTNNTSILGWYLDSPANYQGVINITAAAPSNNGGQYMYTCNGGTDLKLGTRPSNGSGGGPCANSAASTCGHGVGVRLLNTFGNTIVALMISYDWYQFSLAQNGSAINGMFFSYQTGATVTNLTTGSWINVPALDFTAPQSSSTAGSNQINGYPCDQTGSKVACVIVNIPHNTEIMLRWWDPNCSNNDPHLGIDNISITAYSDNVCMIPLPIELIDFYATNLTTDSLTLHWKTKSEENTSYFEIEHSIDAIHFETSGKLNASGISKSLKEYEIRIPQFNSTITNYYRLKTVDFNGNTTLSKVISTNGILKNNTVNIINDPFNHHHKINFQIEKPCNVSIKLFTSCGTLVYEKAKLNLNSGITEYELTEDLLTGTYIIAIEGLNETPFWSKLIY